MIQRKNLIVITTAIMALAASCAKKEGGDKPASSSETEENSTVTAGQVALSGEILLPDGSPAAGAEIYAVGNPQPIGTASATGQVALSVDNSAGSAALTEGDISLYALSSGAGSYGLQLGTFPTAGGKVDFGQKALKETAVLTGVVKLSAKEDHTGIEAYIPGTKFIVKSAANGSYSIDGIPEGSWDIRLESDGYRPADFKATAFTSKNETKLPEIVLFPSTGVHARMSIAGGASKSSSRTVKVKLNYSPNATIYRMSTDSAFTNVDWIPVTDVAAMEVDFTFTAQGQQTLYVDFQDAEGTARSISGSIVIELFAEADSVLSFTGGATSSTSKTVSFTHAAPANATEMMICQNQDMSGCSWQPVSDSFGKTFGQDSATIYIKYKDKDGYESPVFAKELLIDSVAPAFTVTSHGNNEYVPAGPKTMALAGACENGLAIAVSASGATVAAATASCSDGKYNVNFSWTGSSPFSVTASQTDAAGNATSVTRMLHPASMTAASAMGGFTEVFYDDGTYQYLVFANRGLEIWQKSNSTKIAQVALPKGAQDINKTGSHLVVAYSNNLTNNPCGIVTVDVSTPANASVAATTSQTCTDGGTPYLRLENNRAYLAAGRSVHVFDIATPATPSLLVSFGFSGSTSLGRLVHVFDNIFYAVLDDYAYAVDTSVPGNVTTTIANNTNTSTVKTKQYSHLNTSRPAIGYENRIYSVAYTTTVGVISYDALTDTFGSEPVDDIAPFGASAVDRLWIANDRLLATEDNGNIWIYDIRSSGGDPIFMDSANNTDYNGTRPSGYPGITYRRVLSWGSVFSENYGLPTSIDASTPASPATIIHQIPIWSPNRYAAGGNYLCATNHLNNKFYLYRIDTNQKIEQVAAQSFSSLQRCMLTENHVWASDSADTKIYSIGASSLTELATINESYRDLLPVDPTNHKYAAATLTSTRLVNLQTPDAPSVLSSAPTSAGMSEKVQLQRFGNTLVRHTNSFEFFSISGDIEKFATTNSITSIDQMAISSGHIWKTGNAGMFNAYSYSAAGAVQDFSPSFSSAIGSGPYGIAVKGPYLYTSTDAKPLRVYDISNPNSPVLIADLSSQIANGLIYISDNGIWIASGSEGAQWITGVPGTVKP